MQGLWEKVVAFGIVVRRAARQTIAIKKLHAVTFRKTCRSGR